MWHGWRGAPGGEHLAHVIAGSAQQPEPSPLEEFEQASALVLAWNSEGQPEARVGSRTGRGRH